MALPLAQSGVLLEACPLGGFERSHPSPAFVSEGEPGESHMTMRSPVDTFVMSAASGDCQAEGKASQLFWEFGGCFVYVGKLALWRSWACGCRGTRLRALCACVCQCVLGVFIPAPQRGVREDVARSEPLTHRGTWDVSSPIILSDDQLPEWVFS